MKGIVLAGGAGTRLHPITRAVSKQLLPVYDKPMIYYPLSVLMLAGIRDILVISTPGDRPMFQQLLGDGSQLGLRLSHAVQPAPNGLAEAFVIGADHIGDDCVALVLGDNIFHGPGLSTLLRKSVDIVETGQAGCLLFGYQVNDPQRYGVAVTDDEGTLLSIEEKPELPLSNRAITGLYLYDNDVVEIAAGLSPSTRGELEVTDVNQHYLDRRRARLLDLGRGFAWLDTGTHESLLDAGEFVRVIQQRQGIRIACLEETALRMGYIDADTCHALGEQLASSAYGIYVMNLASSHWPIPFPAPA